ncbi:hypothetical protein OOU_Y34scaffold00798g2 [Pyricularia oryzae Y34]|nr:hypothetical protein OOU_Y34scaffold00798g2 [Pyricularia oryzae Y34]
MSHDTIIVRTDRPQPDTDKQAFITALIAEHSLPRDRWTRGSLEDWAFGRYADAIFAEFAASFLIPRLRHPGRQDPTFLPDAYSIVNTPLQAHHILGDADKTAWKPEDHALRFCFALLHSPERDVYNPLIDAKPPKYARNGRTGLYHVAAARADSRKASRERPPPSESELLVAAARVLEVFVRGWKKSSPEYAAFLQLSPRESPLSPVSAESNDGVRHRNFGSSRVATLQRSDANGSDMERMVTSVKIVCMDNGNPLTPSATAYRPADSFPEKEEQTRLPRTISQQAKMPHVTRMHLAIHLAGMATVMMLRRTPIGRFSDWLTTPPPERAQEYKRTDPRWPAALGL